MDLKRALSANFARERQLPGLSFLEDSSFEIENSFLDAAAHEEAFRSAGIREIRWPCASPISSGGSGLWSRLLEQLSPPLPRDLHRVPEMKKASPRHGAVYLNPVGGLAVRAMARAVHSSEGGRHRPAVYWRFCPAGSANPVEAPFGRPPAPPKAGRQRRSGDDGCIFPSARPARAPRGSSPTTFRRRALASAIDKAGAPQSARADP